MSDDSGVYLGDSRCPCALSTMRMFPTLGQGLLCWSTPPRKRFEAVSQIREAVQSCQDSTEKDLVKILRLARACVDRIVIVSSPSHTSCPVTACSHSSQPHCTSVCQDGSRIKSRNKYHTNCSNQCITGSQICWVRSGLPSWRINVAEISLQDCGSVLCRKSWSRAPAMAARFDSSSSRSTSEVMLSEKPVQAPAS